MSTLSHLQIRNPKDDETAIESATQIFSSLLTNGHVGFFNQLFNKPSAYAFEMYLLNQTLYFYISVPKESETFMHSLLSSSYPNSAVQKTTDPVDILFKSPHVSIGEVVLTSSYYYPIKTYTEFSNVDPLAPIIGFLSKTDPNVKMGIQIIVTTPNFPWQSNAIALTQPKPAKEGAAPEPPGPDKSLIQKKIMFQGGKVCIRLVSATNNPGIPTATYLQNLAGTFGGFSLGEGNKFGFSSPGWDKEKLMVRFKERTVNYFERANQILNAQELATIWHPPGKMLAGIRNIAWGKTLSGEPPENLPIADNLTDEERREVNFFAKTEFKNKETIFGLKTPDRRRHVYIIGKTGAGKSTLIANMAIDDIRKDRGVGIIDPHGDLCETILQYVPKRRIQDVVYLEPFDTERPFALNVLEIKNHQHRHLISSGIVSIFAKLYADSWGPRLEYVLRNVILTLLEVPGTTLVDVLGVLSNATYRKKIVAQIKDPVIKTFWEKEFEKMPDRMKAEVISPIQNKVGQFVSARMIRQIIGQPKSTIDLEEIMNSGKIMILNLSQGKLGEDNAALLGAMIITQIQLAAMQRAFIGEEQRRDFMLYVDEFQNFATSSFVKILSEARKYRLCLNLTNQYIDQLDETIRNAIFGNVGTLSSFVVGASDAEILSKEYGELYSTSDLVSLGKHEIVLKISIDNMMSSPFPAKTLPLPALKNDNSERIIALSKEKYGREPTEELAESQMAEEEPEPQQRQYGGGGGGGGGYQQRPYQPRNQNDGAYRPRPQGDRPQGDRPYQDRSQGARPQQDKPQYDRPQQDRQQGNRPKNNGGNRQQEPRQQNSQQTTQTQQPAQQQQTSTPVQGTVDQQQNS